MLDFNRFKLFKDKFTKYPFIYEHLTSNNIPFLIGGSGCLFLLGNKREPDDMDIFLPSIFHDKADLLFGIKSFVYNSNIENVRNSNPFGLHTYQLTSGLKLTINSDKVIDFNINENVLMHKKVFKYLDLDIPLLPPEDVLLIKAILQRGTDVGKHDIDDIKNFMMIYEIDNEYLKDRISQLDISERVKGIF
jgi:hypothetical protein